MRLFHHLLLIGSVQVAAFSTDVVVSRRQQQPQRQRQRQRQPPTQSSFSRATSRTVLFIDFGAFFGGSSSNNKNNEQEQQQHSSSSSSSSKSNVLAGIMESMDDLESAQRVGKLTFYLMSELQSMTVEGSANEGRVKVLFDGQQRPISVNIDEGYFSSVVAAELAQSITMAMQDGHAKSMEKMSEKMRNLYAELGLSPPSS